MNSTVGSVVPLAMFTLDKVKGMQSLLNACYSKACLFEVGSSTICHHNLWAAPFFEAEISPVLQQPPDQRDLMMVGNP